MLVAQPERGAVELAVAGEALQLQDAQRIDGADAARISQSDAGGAPQEAPDEVELVYTGLMRNARGAQASAAHWEAKRLSDDDIADLGYGPDGDADPPSH